VKKSTGIILALLACLIWAGAFPTIKLIYAELGIAQDLGRKMTLAGMRFTLAGILILLFYRIRFKAFPKIGLKKDLPRILALGFVQTTLLYTFFFNGISNATGIKSSILSQSGIFFVIILAHFLLKGEKISYKKIIGLLFGFVGIIVVNINQLSVVGESVFNFSLEGEGFLLLAGFFGALGTIIVKKMGGFAHPVIINGWQMTFGGLILLVYGLSINGELVKLDTGFTVVLFLFLVAIAACAFSIWYILLQHFKANELTIYKFTIPIMGAVLSATFIEGENLSIMILIGLMLVSLGILFGNMNGDKA
jgi:drug/metabolite transporter (DMT)-like permease